MKKQLTILGFSLFCLLPISLVGQVWEGAGYLVSQEDIDNFYQYCNCTEITGDLWIGEGCFDCPDSDITNLDSLIHLEKVGGSVYIGMNNDLENTDGLQNLTYIEKDLDIFYNWIPFSGGSVSEEVWEGLSNLNYIYLVQPFID